MGREEQKVAGSCYVVVPRTLCFVFHGQDVLLLKGDPDKRLWPNQYNGIGGHLEAGEDMETAAQREVEEETGLTVHDLRLRGVVTVDVEPEMGVLIGVFSAQTDSVEMVDSAEGTLAWFNVADLPVGEMVPDVPHLIERVMNSPAGAQPFSARSRYDVGGRLLIEFAHQE
jgi:8-oxo-dGTP diphosphatase